MNRKAHVDCLRHCCEYSEYSTASPAKPPLLFVNLSSIPFRGLQGPIFQAQPDQALLRKQWWNVSPCLIGTGTNLLHYFTAETFSVKLTVFREKNAHFGEIGLVIFRPVSGGPGPFEIY